MLLRTVGNGGFLPTPILSSISITPSSSSSIANTIPSVISRTVRHHTSTSTSSSSSSSSSSVLRTSQMIKMPSLDPPHHHQLQQQQRRRGFVTRLPPKPGDFAESDDTVKIQRSPMRQDPDDFSDGEELIEDAWIADPPKHEATLIWLHGIRDGHLDTKPLFEATKFPNFRYVLPRAPKISVTALDGEDRRTWFDIVDEVICDEDDEEDEYGIFEIQEKLWNLLDFEINLLGEENSRKVFIGGFSNGGAMAIHAGLGYHRPLGGIISYAGYMALPHIYPDHVHDENIETPVLTVHGSVDKAVHIEFARARYEMLKELGVQIESRERFGEGHLLLPEQLVQVKHWMTEQIKKHYPEE